MITPVMHTRVKFHLDQVKSPRLSPSLIDTALNVALSEKYLEDCRHFQLTQEIRDELKPLVINDLALTPSGSVFTYPSDYYREVAFAVVIDGNRRNSTATTYDEKNELAENAFTEPIDKDPVHIESGAGVTSYYTGTLTQGFLSYISTYKQISYSQTFLTNTSQIVIGKTYYVQTGTVTSDSVTYAQGDSFVATATSFTGAGTLSLIQNCQMAGEPCHENICVRAAAILQGTFLGDESRFQVKTSEAGK